MAELTSEKQPTSRHRGVILAAAVLVIELLLIGFVFKHTTDFSCRGNWPVGVCAGVNRLMLGLLCTVAALALFSRLMTRGFHDLVAGHVNRQWPFGVNAAGFLIALIPVLFMSGDAGAGSLVPTLLLWTVGVVLMVLGLVLSIAPISQWGRFVRAHARVILPVAVAGFLTPTLAALLRPVWQLDSIASVTFDAVVWIVSQFGYAVEAYADERVIGNGDFYVSVDKACSGVEGFALVTLFITLYLGLFRQELRFPLAFILYPLGLLASGLFNIFRIALLLIIGMEGNAELAIGGFHSHAGWLMFTLVAMGIIVVAKRVPAFQKATVHPLVAAAPPAVTPFFQDPMVARILPFLIFMATALLASTFSQNPSELYPLRVLIVGATLLAFLPVYRNLAWAPGFSAIGVGAVIGVLWVMIPYAADADAPLPYGDMTGGLLVAWFVARGVGTILCVPILEELFFRDYLPKRLSFGTAWYWPLIGMAVSAVAFAALHGRWAEALVAAIAFQWVYHRTGRISDAIIAHAVANAIVYGVALATGQMHII